MLLALRSLYESPAAGVVVGGVVVGGSATVRTSSAAVSHRPSIPGGFVTPTFPLKRRLEPEPRRLTIIGSGGVVVSGAAGVRTVSVQVRQELATGGLRVGAVASTRVVTPFRNNRAYANAWILRELLEHDDEAA
jgi:hypothetical protein